MKKIPQNFIVLIIAIMITIIIILVIVEFTKTVNTLDHREKIYPFDKETSVPSAIPIKISDLKQGSAIYFMYPPGLSPLGHDNHFQKFMLIRLPLLMGGGNDDLSSFRAYSAVDISSHCLLIYRVNDGPKIQDPCTSPAYRAIDGISEFWPTTNMIRAPSTGALPMLELSVDSDGHIYVEPPTFSAQKNGVVGYGREVTQKEFDDGTSMIKKFNESKEKIMSSFYLPENLGEYRLADIQDENDFRLAKYVKQNDSSNWISISYLFCNCTKTYTDFLATEGKNIYSDFWSISNVDVYATPGKVNMVEGTSTLYNFKFYLDGFRVEVVTDMTFEEGMKLVLENYFQNYSFDDVKKIET